MNVFLESNRGRLGSRYEGFSKCLNMLSLAGGSSIVETGTLREVDGWGDGQSTLIFAEWCRQNNGRLTTVDINATAIQTCLNYTLGLGLEPYISYVADDSINYFLDSPLDMEIDLLYLDSYDYDETNPLPSQKHCMHEFFVSERFLHSGSIIVVDDADLEGGGKPGLLNAYLDARGYRMIWNSKQVIWQCM